MVTVSASHPSVAGSGAHILPWGRDGRLWVRDFAPPWEEGSWRVFDAEGRWIGSVTVPPRTRLLDLAGDRILVELTDELGVTTVRVLPLR